MYDLPKKEQSSSCFSSEVEPFGVGLKALEIPSTRCQGVGGGGGAGWCSGPTSTIISGPSLSGFKVSSIFFWVVWFPPSSKLTLSYDVWLLCCALYEVIICRP